MPVTGQGGINNTVGQERGSRRGEWGGPLRKAHPGPRDTRGHVGPGDADMGTRGAGRTQKRVRVGWGHKGRHTQRKGVGGQALELVQRASSSPHPGAAAANGWVLSWDWAGPLPHRAKRWALGQGPARMGPRPAEGAGGLGLNFALGVLVIDVAAHGSGVHSCRERREGGRKRGGGWAHPDPPGHTHPWVRRVFRSRACGSRAGRRARNRTGAVRPGAVGLAPPATSSRSRRPSA